MFLLLPPSLPRQKTQIIETDGRRLASTGQPLQNLRREIGEARVERLKYLLHRGIGRKEDALTGIRPQPGLIVANWIETRL